jgi:hypothetical protein
MSTMNHVPCNGCTLCCVGDAVRILPGEDAGKWETEAHPLLLGSRMLAHKRDGTCYYQGSTGCTIQHDKPQQCREMDCRAIASRLTYTQARKMNIRLVVWKKGKELLAEDKA